MGKRFDEITENIAERKSVDIGINDIILRSASTEIDAEKADSLISDSIAKSLIEREGEIVYTEGEGRGIINLGDISPSFAEGDTVNINTLKEKGLIASDIAYLKVLGGGKIDKPLTIQANDFSLSAVKMIALSGGHAVKIVTFKRKRRDEKG